MKYNTLLDITKWRDQQNKEVAFNYVKPEEVKAKMYSRLRWVWLEKIVSEIPEGKCVAFEVEKGYTCFNYASKIRSALMTARGTLKHRYSVRQSTDENYVIVAKVEEWRAEVGESPFYNSKQLQHA